MGELELASGPDRGLLPPRACGSADLLLSLLDGIAGVVEVVGSLWYRESCREQTRMLGWWRAERKEWEIQQASAHTLLCLKTLQPSSIFACGDYANLHRLCKARKPKTRPNGSETNDIRYMSRVTVIGQVYPFLSIIIRRGEQSFSTHEGQKI